MRLVRQHRPYPLVFLLIVAVSFAACGSRTPQAVPQARALPTTTQTLSPSAPPPSATPSPWPTSTPPQATPSVSSAATESALAPTAALVPSQAKPRVVLTVAPAASVLVHFIDMQLQNGN